MGSTFLSLNYHIVFSTKDRRPFVRAEWRPRFHAYLGGIIRKLGGTPVAVGGVEDHLHGLVGLKASHCLAGFMREFKKGSSIWAAENHEEEFGWQDGYAAFAVSYSHIHPVKLYIGKQEKHHEQISFMDELKRLLEKNGVKYDPKYLL